MLTYGVSTPVDLLSWVVVVALAVKLGATAILLVVGKHHRDHPGWGSGLWWATKLTPVLAVPCLIAIMILEGLRDQIWILLALLAFVMVAVPLKVRQRRRRIAAAGSAGPSTGR